MQDIQVCKSHTWFYSNWNDDFDVFFSFFWHQREKRPTSNGGMWVGVFALFWVVVKPKTVAGHVWIFCCSCCCSLSLASKWISSHCQSSFHVSDETSPPLCASSDGMFKPRGEELMLFKLFRFGFCWSSVSLRGTLILTWSQSSEIRGQTDSGSTPF